MFLRARAKLTLAASNTLRVLSHATVMLVVCVFLAYRFIPCVARHCNLLCALCHTTTMLVVCVFHALRVIPCVASYFHLRLPLRLKPSSLASMSDAMCDELACVGELLTAQVDAGQSREDVLECMFRSWMQRLSHATHITTHKAKTLLTQSINTGPWTSDQCRDLAACVLAGKKTASKAARR